MQLLTCFCRLSCPYSLVRSLPIVSASRISPCQRIVCAPFSSSNGSESDSERWRRLISDSDAGFSSTFEDDEGNILYPRRKPTHAVALRPRKVASTIDRKSSFVDWIKVQMAATAGTAVTLFLRADPQIKSLAGVHTINTADCGKHGEGKDIIGASGEHKFVDVPVGTLVKCPETEEIIAELDEPDSMFIAARGGQGGKGNHFYLSNKNRHPRVAEVGAKGEDKVLVLEMRCVADCGFVGFPNVGKSSLLRALSRARPRVASYPFTTLNPYIGVIQYDDFYQLTVADLPGIIADAHLNRGLGISFLKHIERCVCLMFVVDLSQDEPWNQLIALKRELELYKPALSKQPHAVVANKWDCESGERNYQALKEYMERMTPAGALPLPVIPVSAKYGHNVKELVDHIRALFDMYRADDDLQPQ